MATRDYPRLGPVEFARQLIQTGDLDPIYVALNNSGYDRDQKLRWLCAYIAFYHAGVACWMSERTGEWFWAEMMKAARNEQAAPVDGRWPRSSERRHFRGQQAVAAIEHWQGYGAGCPETMFYYISSTCAVPGGHRQTLAEVMDKAKEYRSVGAWAAFKIADLCDACLGANLDQGDLEPFLYDTPRKGFVMMAERFGVTTHPSDTLRGEQALALTSMQHLERQLSDLAPPHKPGQRIDNFVLETASCKWKSHMGGHYPPGKDLKEIAEGLEPWAKVCQSAQQFLAAMPKQVEEV